MIPNGRRGTKTERGRNPETCCKNPGKKLLAYGPKGADLHYVVSLSPGCVVPVVGRIARLSTEIEANPEIWLQTFHAKIGEHITFPKKFFRLFCFHVKTELKLPKLSKTKLS
jgi:hypothetical protein